MALLKKILCLQGRKNWKKLHAGGCFPRRAWEEQKINQAHECVYTEERGMEIRYVGQNRRKGKNTNRLTARRAMAGRKRKTDNF